MDGTNLTTMILIGAVIVLVMVAGIILYLMRDRLLGSGSEEMPGSGGILETMRGMRDRGEISEEEYRTAQAAIVAKASAKKTSGQGVEKTKPVKIQTADGKVGELRAAPGFDLTGERLPPAARRATEENETDFD